MIRQYQDFVIKAEVNNETHFASAEFYIPKVNGVKEHWQFYQCVCKTKTKPSAIISIVITIIDALYYGKTDENAGKSV